MAFCVKCGKEIADDAIFCRYCGSGALPIAPEETEIKKPEKKKSDKPVSAGEAGAKSIKLPIIICAAVILCVGAALLILKLTENPGKKIASAFNKTLNAKSFVCEVETESSNESYLLEVSSSKSDTRYYFKFEEDHGYIYSDGKLYEQIHYRNRFNSFFEIEGKNSVKTAERLADRDIAGALKNSKTVKSETKKVCRNVDEILPIAQEMLADYFKDPDEHDYIQKYKKKGNTYRFVVDFVSLVKTARRDYDLDINIAKLGIDGYKEILFDIEVTLDKGYLKQVEITYEDDYDFTYAAYFKKINSVDYDNCQVSGFMEEIKDQERARQPIETYKTYVEAALKKAQKNDYMFSGYEDLVVEDFYKDIDISTPDSYKNHAKAAAKVLNENGVKGQLYLGYCDKGEGYYGGYFIQYRESPDAKYIVQAHVKELDGDIYFDVDESNYKEVEWGKYFKE